uniref:Putative 16.8 kDa salivary protein n=2 Tax=Culex tarsalis TaxID=7177 RepID=A0A1Q3FIK9_CULTA
MLVQLTNMKFILALFLAVVSVVVAEVPTGCVTILNTSKNTYLKAANVYDKKHRHVKHAKGAENWEIQKSGNNYRIMHVKHQEYLFASYWTFNEANYVYLWMPKTDEESDKWEIQLYPGASFYYIKNIKRGSCMFPSIFEWIYAMKDFSCHAPDELWKIEKC